jgi:nucleotide-binding universal stress UspA family protein
MLERILLAMDESEHARKAVPAAVELARAGGGMVHVLHVRELVYAGPAPRWSAAALRRPSSSSTVWSRS